MPLTDTFARLSLLSAERDPFVLRIVPFDQTLRDERDTLEEPWIAFLRTRREPLRFLTFTRPINLHHPIARLQARKQALAREQQLLAPIAAAVASWPETRAADCMALRAALPADVQPLLDCAMRQHDPQERASWVAALDRISERYWVVDWLDEYLHAFGQMQTQLDLRTLEHYLIAYPGPEVTPEAFVQDATRGFGTPVHRVDTLPPLIAGDGDYEEQLDHLAPRRPDLPYLAFLVVHTFPAEQAWTVETLRCLFDLDLDVALCIDIATEPLWWQKIRADHEEAIRTFDAAQAEATRDRRAKKKQRGAAAIGDLLEEQQQLHQVRVVLAVRADSLELLRRHISTLVMSCATVMEWVQPTGGQQALARFFDPTPTTAIDAWCPILQEPTHGVAVMLPIGFKKHGGTEGVWWGFAGSVPILYDPVQDSRGEKIAGHTNVSGQTGSGKTTAANTWAMRMLALGTQICVFEPQGHAAKFIQACGRGGRRYVLSMNECYNPLDVVVGRDEHGRPPPITEQAQAVLNQLSILLGTLIPSLNGAATFAPRQWDPTEAALIEMALAQVYGPWADNLEGLLPERAPVVADLCDALRDLDVGTTTTTRQLRDQILDQLYLSLVRGPKGRQYNRRTTVEWDFARDAIAYDFTRITDGPAQMLTIGKALGAVNTYVRSQHRDRRRPFVNIWDELAFTLRKAPPLAPWLEDASRAWRTFLAMLMSLDQHLSTWLEGSLRVMFDQSPNKFIFYQPSSQAAQLEHLVDGVQPEHIRAIPAQRQGQFTLIRKVHEGLETNEVIQGELELTTMEWQAFRGM